MINDPSQNKKPLIFYMAVAVIVIILLNPQRFDVVICRYPGRGDTNFVKRVVGLPGDTIEIRDGYLWRQIRRAIYQ